MQPAVIIRGLWTLKSSRLVYVDFFRWLLIPIMDWFWNPVGWSMLIFPTSCWFLLWTDFEIQRAGLCWFPHWLLLLLYTDFPNFQHLLGLEELSHRELVRGGRLRSGRGSYTAAAGFIAAPRPHRPRQPLLCPSRTVWKIKIKSFFRWHWCI